MIKVPPAGQISSPFLIVGEAPGAEEERHLTPFVGAAGQELDRLLHETGFLRSDFFITNVCKHRPPNNDISQWIYEKKNNPPPGFIYHLGKWVHPFIKEGYDELLQEIERANPKLIFAFGKTALWALTQGEKDTIGSWRGSQLILNNRRVLPTIHPAAILRQWEFRSFVVLDLKRAKRWLDGEAEPRNYLFTVRPSYEAVQVVIHNLLLRAESTPSTRLSVDLETRAGHLACCGIAWSAEQAISIPFMCTERAEGYWSLEEEAAIIVQLQKLFTHPNVSIVGQNFNYDAQYIWRYWRFVPNFRDDTMIAQATVLPGLPKSLDFIASMYNRHYSQWKLMKIKSKKEA